MKVFSFKHAKTGLTKGESRYIRKDNMIDLDGKTVLVTGGCGFIGSNFVEYLNEYYKNLTIINVDKHGIGHRAISLVKKHGNNYVELVDDVRNIAITTAIDVVFHFAAESHVDRSITGPLEFIENNVMGIAALMEWVRMKQPKARVINVSTDEVYGHLQAWDAPFTEKSPLNPRSPYSASKASADLIASSYVQTFGLDVITTRCCNNYGPHQADEKFIPTVIRSVLQGNPVPVYGNGKNVREWIFVEDHVKSILEIAEKGYSGTVYNVGTGVEKENLEIIKDISRFLGIDVEIQFVDDRKGHDFRYAIDSLRYFPDFEKHDYQDALAATVNHYVQKYGKNG